MIITLIANNRTIDEMAVSYVTCYSDT